MELSHSKAMQVLSQDLHAMTSMNLQILLQCLHSSDNPRCNEIFSQCYSRAEERDDLKALLMATLKRLEAVDRVVQRADQSNAAMEAQVASLQQERDKASEAAATAQGQVEALLKSQRRVDWQNKVRTCA